MSVRHGLFLFGIYPGKEGENRNGMLNGLLVALLRNYTVVMIVATLIEKRRYK